MRTTKKFKRISVTDEIHKRLLEDRDHFQEVIGGGKWSISDTIEEYLKILNTYKEK
jgi:predicted CopG family antitoxin